MKLVLKEVGLLMYVRREDKEEYKVPVRVRWRVRDGRGQNDTVLRGSAYLVDLERFCKLGEELGIKMEWLVEDRKRAKYQGLDIPIPEEDELPF